MKLWTGEWVEWFTEQTLGQQVFVRTTKDGFIEGTLTAVDEQGITLFTGDDPHRILRADVKSIRRR